MALGGASLVVVLLVWLWNPWPPDGGGGGGGRAEGTGNNKVSAPPDLVAKVPLAAKALVAAGYTSTAEEESAEVEATAAHGMASEVVVVTPGPGGTSSGKEAVVIVGDSRYSWQPWSPWHCNCPAGSMSRVRNITYAVPGVRLDPVQYNVLRLEREVCSYALCPACNRTARECDRPAVPCAKGPDYLCALDDIRQDREHLRRHFWTHVHQGLKKLWQTVREAFPSQAAEKITKDNNKERPA
ncbi:protein MENT [Pogona vitticeps]